MPVLLPATTIGAAAANVLSGVTDLKANGQKLPLTLAIQFTFLYGAGGTSLAAYLQTSFDGGVNWQDVASFSALLANKRETFIVNRQVSKLTPVTNQDGALTADTALDYVGPIYRVKYTSVGTYTGATSLRVDVIGEN